MTPATAAALDHAIADTASTEFARLTRGLNVTEKARRVVFALDTLHGSLRRREMPDYASELVALFYSLWYHPFQVNSAAALVRNVVELRGGVLTDQPKLHIVDFGSGAGAFQAGLTLAALELKARRQSLPGISLDLIEPNDAMFNIGRKIAAYFAAAATNLPAIRAQRIERIRDIEPEPESERWLVALHAFYEPDKDSVRESLGLIHHIMRPTVGLMTYHRGAAELVAYVSPFGEALQADEIPPLPLRGELSAVNQWRRQLAEEMDMGDEARLTDAVTWNPARGARDNQMSGYITLRPGSPLH